MTIEQTLKDDERLSRFGTGQLVSLRLAMGT